VFCPVLVFYFYLFFSWLIEMSALGHSLSTLPPEILLLILRQLGAEDAHAMATTCHALAAVARTPSLWEAYLRRDFGLSVDREISVSSSRWLHRRMDKQKWSNALGLWRRTDVSHYGSLHQVVYDGQQSLLMVQWLPPRDPKAMEELRPYPFLKVILKEDGETTIKLQDEMLLFGCPPGFSPHVEITAWGNHLTADVKDLPDTTIEPVAWNEQLTRFLKRETGDEEASMDADNELLMLKFLCLYSNRNMCDFVRLRPERQWLKWLATPLPIRPGLFKGTYGPHGIEIVELRFERSDDETLDFAAEKVTGDPNVPSGETTFRGSLTDAVRLSEEDQLNMLTIMTPEVQAAAFPWLGEEAGQHVQPFKVPDGCFSRREDGSAVFRTCLARFLCRCRVAGHNYLNPEWIDGQLAVLDEDTFSVLFFQLHSMSYYYRVKENLAAVNLSEVKEISPF